MLITEFYRNKELFVTGGTGYLGKSLIEKLLRTCTGISKIYLLVRTKKNKTPLERINDYQNDPVFERLHREQPKAFEKIIPIAGDCFEIGLGISPEDLEKIKNVHMIIHGAANVRFDNNLRGSILMNTRGTHELLKIAVNCKNLLAFVHISTGYINPFESYIEEKLYNTPFDWRSTIKIAETYDDVTLEILKLKYTDFYPNPYTFSKNLSEQIVAEFSDRLPVTILRPSIVIQSVRDPEPGYIDNLNGPMGLLVAITLGISLVTYCNRDLVMTMIFVDYVTDFTIIGAYTRCLKTLNSDKCGLDIRNIAPGRECCTTLDEFIELSIKTIRKNPLERSLWAPWGKSTMNFYLFMTCVFLVNIPIAFIYDTLLKLSGKETMVMNIMRKYVYTSKALGKFSHQQFEFQNDGLYYLLSQIPEEEKHIFEISESEYIEEDYSKIFENLFLGVRKYILKEPLISSNATKRRFKFLVILDKIIKILVIYFIIKFLWQIIN